MPSSSDYTLAKKLVNIQQNLDFIVDMHSQPEYSNAFSTVIGNDLTPCEGQCIGEKGPPGEPGDKYLTTFTDTLYKYIIDSGSIGIQVETGLAYIHGHTIRCVHDGLNPPYDSFTAKVMSYNTNTGVMILNSIQNVSEGFIYSIKRTYKVNIDYYFNNPQQAIKLPIMNDVSTNSPCYIQFTKQLNGEAKILNTSKNLYFNPSNGELHTNSVFEMNTNDRINVSPLDEYDSIDFIRNLHPKKYYTSNKPSLERYGFLPEEVLLIKDDLGLIDNSGIAFSDILAPVVSTLKTVLGRLESAEYRLDLNNTLYGELHTNSLFETNINNNVNITPLDEYDSVEFIQNLHPKKYYASNKPTLERYGFLPGDIQLIKDNLGLIDNNGISYSDILASLVSTVQTVLNRLDSVENKVLSFENRITALENNSLPIAPPVLLSSLPPTISVPSSQPDNSCVMNLINIAMQNYNPV